MTFKERVLYAFDHKEADKVPRGEPLIDKAVIVKLLGNKATGERFKDKVAVMEMLNMDMVGAASTFTPSPYKETVGKTSSGRRILRDGWRAIYVESDYGSLTAGLLEYPIKNIKEIRTYEFPPLEQYRTDEIEKWVKETNYFIFANVWGGKDMVVPLVGYENYMIYSKFYPEELHFLIKKFTNYQAEIAKKYINAGAHGIWIGDDLAGNQGPFFSPPFYQEILFPCLKEEISAIKKYRDVPVVFHSDGNITSLLDDLVDLPIDGLNPLEPHAGMDISYVKKKYGARWCLVGNIDTTYLLPRGTPEEIEKVVRETIEICAPGGGYILASANMLTADVPRSNALAMYRSAEKYGKYR